VKAENKTETLTARCPECNISYKITTASKATLRCGGCLSVFSSNVSAFGDEEIGLDRVACSESRNPDLDKEDRSYDWVFSVKGFGLPFTTRVLKRTSYWTVLGANCILIIFVVFQIYNLLSFKSNLPISSATVAQASEIPGVLSINLQFENVQGHEVPYPTIDVRFEDQSGEEIAQNYFYPRDYLEADRNIRGIAGNQRVFLQLDVLDPGAVAYSYTLGLQ
tara:strand:- start:92 stop:754 length:663 start_codon:yes stop_codon:yes gene_type:complete